MVWKRNPSKVKPATVSLLLTASLVLLAGITPPAGADTVSDLQQFTDRCIHTDTQKVICVPNLDQICGDVGPVSCEFTPSECLAFCSDTNGPSVVVSFTPFSVGTPSVEAWVTNCNVAGATVPQVTIGSTPGCPIGNSPQCEDGHSEPLQSEDLLPTCWRFFIAEQTVVDERPTATPVQDVIPLSLLAMCTGSLSMSVGPQPVLTDFEPVVAPCSGV